LFQPLGLLQRSDAERGIIQQEIALIDVEADVLVVNAAHAIAVERDGAARKINCIAGVIGDNLHDIWVGDLTWVSDLLLQRRHQDVRIVRNGQDCSVDGVGIDERLITLDVHNDLCAFGAGDFRDAIRARNVIFACHSDACPKHASRVKYTWVVGGNDRAEKIPCLGGPFVSVLQHGLASQRGQNFAGETGGRESGRDDAEKFTRHTRGYHKTPMLHSGKKGWPANMRQSYRKLLIVSGIGLWGCALWGQATIETRPRPGLKAEPRQQANIRVDTNLVLIPVTVTDPMNRFVTGLEKENFKL